MPDKVMFDYYYGAQADMHTFYRIPKLLFTCPHFARLSNDARILYGMMLDRMGLSVRNHWFDEQGRAYIYFSLDDTMEQLGCGHNKAVKIIQELDSDKGIGLIERQKQGQGRSSIIYVKNFVVNGHDDFPEHDADTTHCADFRKPEIKTSEKRKSRLPKTGSQDFPKTEANDNELKDIYGSDIKSHLIRAEQGEMRCDGMRESTEDYEETIRANIAYDALISDHPDDKETIDGIVRLILETVISTKEYILISGDKRPAALVKEQMLRLGHEHIEYVLSAMAANTTDVRNIRQYLLASLYNAPNTIDSFYRAKVNHDFPQYAHR